MSEELGVFFVLAAVALWSAFRVVTSRIITHSAMYLALAFVAVAGWPYTARAGGRCRGPPPPAAPPPP